MRSALVDTNILIDLLDRRDPFYEEAAGLFSMADRNEVALSMSALSVTTTHYILSRQLKLSRTREILRKLRVLVHTIALTDKIIELSLNDTAFPDFEDAVQYYSATEHKDEIIITRNLKDFRKATLPVMTAGQFLELS